MRIPFVCMVFSMQWLYIIISSLPCQYPVHIHKSTTMYSCDAADIGVCDLGEWTLQPQILLSNYYFLKNKQMTTTKACPPYFAMRKSAKLTGGWHQKPHTLKFKMPTATRKKENKRKMPLINNLRTHNRHLCKSLWVIVKNLYPYGKNEWIFFFFYFRSPTVVLYCPLHVSSHVGGPGWVSRAPN